MRIKIHQIDRIEEVAYAFRSFNPGKFNFKDYKEVYELESESLDDKTNLEICEDVFYVFNMRKPEDFEGHSLSVSDIIEIIRHGSSSFYYCDMCGFSRLNRHDLREW